MFALFLYLTLYLQNFLGHSPTEAGLRYLPMTVAIFLVAPIAGALLSRVQARVMLSLGLIGAGAGLLLMAGVDVADDWTGLLGGFIVAGASIGLLNPVIADVALSVVPKEQSGMASGINDTFRQVGVALGVAVWGAIFLGTASSKVQEATGLGADRSRELVEATSSGNLDQALTQVPAGSRAQVADAAREGFLAGFNDIAVFGGILAIAAGSERSGSCASATSSAASCDGPGRGRGRGRTHADRRTRADRGVSQRTRALRPACEKGELPGENELDLVARAGVESARTRGELDHAVAGRLARPPSIEEARQPERSPGHQREAVDHRTELDDLKAGLLGGDGEAVGRPVEDAARVERLELRGRAGEEAARLKDSRDLA